MRPRLPRGLHDAASGKTLNFFLNSCNGFSNRSRALPDRKIKKKGGPHSFCIPSHEALFLFWFPPKKSNEKSQDFFFFFETFPVLGVGLFVDVGSYSFAAFYLFRSSA